MIRILGVGSHASDGVLRRSSGESFEVVLGDEELHEEMRELCLQLMERLGQLGLELHDLSSEQLTELLVGLGVAEDRGCAS